MRVMIDTNILVSVLLFPSQQMNTLIYKITTEHQLVLSSYVVDELLNVVRRKFKDKLEAADLLLSQLPYELVYTPEHMKPELFEIRDEKDYPVFIRLLQRMWMYLSQAIEILKDLAWTSRRLSIRLDSSKNIRPCAAF